MKISLWNPRKYSATLNLTLHWSSYQVEAFRRLSNTHNQISIQYKSQLLINNEFKTANCDLFPLPNYIYNLSSLIYPSRTFYCSCKQSVGCQSKQCRYELNKEKQGKNFGDFCRQDQDHKISGDLNNFVKSHHMLFDKTSYGRWLGDLKLLSSRLVKFAPFEVSSDVIRSSESGQTADKKDQVKRFSINKVSGKYKIEVPGEKSSKDILKNMKIHFIGDHLYEQIFNTTVEMFTQKLGKVPEKKTFPAKNNSCTFQKFEKEQTIILALKGIVMPDNFWNIPVEYRFPSDDNLNNDSNYEISFTAHGLPSFHGGCLEHYKFTADQILDSKFTNNKDLNSCVIVLALGSQFNTINPTIFYNRLVEIKKAIFKARKLSSKPCKYIFAPQPFNEDSKRFPMYGFSWYSYRQYLISKYVFDDMDDVKIIDVLSYTSTLFGLGIHKNLSGGKIPDTARELISRLILREVRQLFD